uniref:Uncharacterized protein n=1 Tax=Arundo donax TaxID=35708 RepID=A0A0A9FT90_ARUDO
MHSSTWCIASLSR